MVDSASCDKIVMLLSSDWFGPYWRAAGLAFSPEEQRLVQKAARGAVTEMMKGASTYWNANFSDGRVRATEATFLASIRATVGKGGASEQILGIREQQTTLPEQVTTSLWLFCALADQLASATPTEPIPGLSTPTLRTVCALWQMSASEEFDTDELERALLASDTHWDRYLRGLTPDLPTYLSDWVAKNLGRPTRFRRFWAELFWVISGQERKVLHEWFAAEARKLADPGFELTFPEWLRLD